MVRHRLPGLGRPGLHRTLDRHPRRAVHAGHAGGRHLRGHRGRPADAARHRHLRAGAHRRHRLGPGDARRRVRRVHGRLRLDHRRPQLHLRPHRGLDDRADQLHPGAGLAQRVLRRSRAWTWPGRRPRPSPRSSPAVSPTWRASCRPSGWPCSPVRAPSSGSPCSPRGPTWPRTAATWPGCRPSPPCSPTTPCSSIPTSACSRWGTPPTASWSWSSSAAGPGRVRTCARARPPICWPPPSCGSPAGPTSSTASTPRAGHDPLTGLANRRSLMERIEMEMSHALRADTPLTLAMIDLDHFKEFNDRYGHVAGDTVLRSRGRHDGLQYPRPGPGVALRRRGVLPGDARHRPASAATTCSTSCGRADGTRPPTSA